MIKLLYVLMKIIIYISADYNADNDADYHLSLIADPSNKLIKFF